MAAKKLSRGMETARNELLALRKIRKPAYLRSRRRSISIIPWISFQAPITVKEKKVELIELFYDLVYVYAISRMTLILEEPEGGALRWTCWPYTSSPPWS